MPLEDALVAMRARRSHEALPFQSSSQKQKGPLPVVTPRLVAKPRVALQRQVHLISCYATGIHAWADWRHSVQGIDEAHCFLRTGSLVENDMAY